MEVVECESVCPEVSRGELKMEQRALLDHLTWA